MPKDEKQDVDKLVDAPKTAKIAETENQVVTTTTHKASSLLLIIVAILLFFTVAVGAGSALMLIRSNHMPHRGEMIIYGQRNMPFSNHMYIETNSSSTTNSIISSGVVTSVNGSSFIIAGNSNQTTINTTGDTTYNTTNKKVSVNDSVIVAGAKSNDTITATDVRIMNF